jgi:hypothetical protein
MKEFKWWILASLIMFALAFIERAGRPLIYLAVALLVVGIFSWFETEYREYENKASTKRKRKRDFEQTMQVTRQIDDFGNKKIFDDKKIRKNKQPRDFHGRFIKNIKRRK